MPKEHVDNLSGFESQLVHHIWEMIDASGEHPSYQRQPKSRIALARPMTSSEIVFLKPERIRVQIPHFPPHMGLSSNWSVTAPLQGADPGSSPGNPTRP